MLKPRFVKILQLVQDVTHVTTYVTPDRVTFSLPREDAL